MWKQHEDGSWSFSRGNCYGWGNTVIEAYRMYSRMYAIIQQALAEPNSKSALGHLYTEPNRVLKLRRQGCPEWMIFGGEK